MKESEKYGTTVDGIEWEIDLERKRLISIKNPKLIRKLSKKEIKRIRRLMKMKKYNLILVLGLVLSLTSFVSADMGNSNNGGCWNGMGGMMTGSYGFGGMFFGWIFGILIIVVLILLIAWLIKQINKK
jgi:hypothetical protein